MNKIDLQELAKARGIKSTHLRVLGPTRAAELSLLQIMSRSIRLVEKMIRERPDLFQGIKIQLSHDAAPKENFRRKLLVRGPEGEPWWMVHRSLKKTPHVVVPVEVEDAIKNLPGLDTTQGLQMFIEVLRYSVDQQTKNSIPLLTEIFTAEERRNRKKLTATVKETFKVDLENLLSANDVREQVKVAVSQSASLIRGLNDDLVKKVEFSVLDAAQKGQSTTQLSERLRKDLDISRSRARLIARDQVASLNAALAKVRQEQLGVDKYVWETAQDERVRHEHRLRQGKVFSWDDPPEDGHPGEPINCFPGSTIVDLSNGCRKLWRRFYTGSLVTIETSHGRFLKATPNHPILTTRGWLLINDLNKGDYVITESESLWSNKANDNGLKTSFKDLFNSAAASQSFESWATTPFDFHGDATNDHVDVITVNGRLDFRREASSFGCFNQFKLSESNIDVLSKLSVSGSCESSASRLSSLSESLVGSAGQDSSFVQSHFGMASNHGIASPSSFNFVLEEDSVDHGSRDLVPVGEGDFTLPVNVGGNDLFLREMAGSVLDLRDEVISKTIEHFSGPVFNMETDTGYYIANAIVVHNCRCVALPWISNS